MTDKPLIKALSPDRTVVRGQFARKDDIDARVFDALFEGDNIKQWTTYMGESGAGNLKQRAVILEKLGVINADDLNASLERIFKKLALEAPTVAFEGEQTALIRMPITTYIVIQDYTRVWAEIGPKR